MTSRVFRSALCVLAFLLPFLAFLAFLLLYFVPSLPTESALIALSPAAEVDRLVNRVQSSALQGLAPVKKIYRLPEDALTAPEPDAAAYFHTSSAEEVLSLFEEAQELLNGRQPLFTGDTPFVVDRGIYGYWDESILTLVWYEQDGASLQTYAEVFLADASQFRRKLSGDEYGGGVYKFPTDMALECNAVLAAAADFYRFRPYGIHGYQRQIYHVNGEKVDTCWVDSGGNLLFTRRGEIMTTEEAEAFMEANDVLFTLSFGPVMIENYQKTVPEYYWLGESRSDYPRACIAQDGELHYLLCVTRNPMTVSQAADMMMKKGVERCYALDGGQSGTIVMEGKALNPSIYGYGNAAQRVQSDIIYFATAIPDHG